MGTVDNHVHSYVGNFSVAGLCTFLESYAARIGTSSPQGIRRIYELLSGKQGNSRTYCYY